MPKKIKNNLVLDDSKLRAILRDNNVRKTTWRPIDGSYTHTSIGNPKGSYAIKNSDLDSFHDIYHDEVFKKEIPTHLTEGIRDREFTQIKIDLDFRYYGESLDRIYKKEYIFKICTLYMKCLEEYIQTICDDKDIEENESGSLAGVKYSEREFIILEKPSPTYYTDSKGNKKTHETLTSQFLIKDGVHIMAPYIITNAWLQHNIRDKVLKSIDELVFDDGVKWTDIGWSAKNYDIIDKAVISDNNWQMYGSCKPNMPPYLVTNIIMCWGDKYEILDSNKYSGRQLIDLLSVRNKASSDYTMIKLELENHVFEQNNSMLNQKIKKALTKKKRKKSETKLKKKEVKLVMKYIDCLNEKRASSFHSWIQVGWCLYNLHNKDDQLLIKWIEFSKKSKDYASEAEESCREKWNEMHKDSLGIGTLKLWAREDNPEQYRKVIEEDVQAYILKCSQKENHHDVAQVLYCMYKDYFVCLPNTLYWYYFDQLEHRWIGDKKGMTLKSKISKEVYNEFKRIQMKQNKQSLEAGDVYAIRASNVQACMDKLKNSSYKKNIMTECEELFMDKNTGIYKGEFYEKLDCFNHLICCKNGVYDLNKEEFRTGRPEDLMSKSTKVNYREYDPDSDDIKGINKMIKGIFPIKYIREYVMLRTSSFLSGSTKEECFDIFSGKGGNGKSKLMELIIHSIGEYGCNLPVSLITAKRTSSSAATPELAQTKGARLAYLQEPDTKTKINVGLMKELTGGDKIQARALYHDPIEFKPQFKMVLCCNDKPELPPHDEGTWRRIRNTEFISKFTYDPNINNPLEWKIDLQISERFDDWKETFLGVLVHYHKKYKKVSPLKAPDEIIQFTQSYRATNEHFKDFVNQKIEEDENETYLSIEKIYIAYKQWYQDNHADNNMKKRKDLQRYLDDTYNKNWKPSDSKNIGYSGIKLILHDNFETSSCEIIDELGN